MSPGRARTAIASALRGGLGLRLGRARVVALRPVQLGAVVAIVVLAASLAVAAFHYQTERDDQVRRAWATRAADELRDQYDQAAAAVLGVRALFAASNHVTEDEFARFAAVQQSGSVVHDFVFAPRLSAAARGRFERTTGLRVLERAPGGALRPARARGTYYPLRYIAPGNPANRALLGLDVGPGAAGLSPARDSGEPALAGPFAVTPGPEAPVGAAIAVAIYEQGAPLRNVGERRAALVGFAGSAFLFEDLVVPVIELLPPRARVELVADGRTVVGTPEGGPPATSETIAAGGRRWTIRVGLDDGPARVLLPAAIAGGGIVVSLLLALLFSESNRRRREREGAQARLGALVRNSTDLIAVVDARGRIAYQSPAALALLGASPEALIGTPARDLLHPEDADMVLAPLSDPGRRPGQSTRMECRWRTAAGGWLSAETTLTNAADDPDVRGWVLNTRDVSERKALEAELVHQAFHDPLTGLANRALFTDRATHALERRGAAAAALFCDLDDFKRINDGLGHHAGDQLLVELARRLRGCVRAGDTVARLGGDEFALLLENELSVEGAEQMAERVLAAVSAPLALAGEDVTVAFSVGIATTDEAESAEELLRNADVAMYAAKAAGKGTFAHYEAEMHAALLDRLSLTADLAHALERQEFRVHYQPLVELGGRGVVGFEALARWDHPRRGLIGPAQFIPLAEETGQIVELGESVLVQACHQARRWQVESPEQSSLTMNVNLSARQLADPHLPERVERALRESGLEPERLVLEITESVLMRDGEATTAALHKLKALGVRLAIDDFGTGYSSLGYLERLPVDQLKVDRVFVESIDRPGGAPLVQAILEIGRLMGLEVTAEGVERAGQADCLEAAGVHLAQGYYFARPASAGQVEATLRGGPLPCPEAPAAGTLAEPVAPAPAAGGRPARRAG